jgi:ABC-type nitrate/sulfonate/bicarbonate transport system substrate-binding protein
MSLQTLRLIAFPGAPNLPIFAAIEQGDFEREGLAVELETTPSSKFQMESLVAGQFDIAATAYDNVVAYCEGQGAVAFDVAPDLFVLMGATRIELSLVASTECATVAELCGRPLALDAVATGFAFVLYDMLEHAGCTLAECELVPVGATPQRWDALRNGQVAATLMIEPFTSIACAQGFRMLESSVERLPRYQGGIFASRRRWAAEHRVAVDGFIRAYRRGLDWVLAVENRDAAMRLLLERMPAIKPAVAPAVIGKLLDPTTGLTPGGAIDPDGMRTVLALRSRYARPQKALDRIEPYLDLSFFERATAG